MKKITTITMLAAGICSLAVQQAQANSMITGTVDISGGITLNTTSLATDTEILTFKNSSVENGNGNYTAPGNDNPTVTWAQPLSFAVGPEVMAPLWTFTDGAVYSFNLASIASYVVDAADDSATLKGYGTLTETGYQNTPGNFVLDITDAGASSTAKLSFASSDTAAAVPDGGVTVALLGSAMTAMALIRRKL